MVARDVPNDPILWAQGTLTQLAADDPAEQISPSEFVAFHGSPHDFDRFDITKIDYSDGCKAYGYGLYFAECKKVAEWYRVEDPDAEDDQSRGRKGPLYEVRIHINPECMLDWDKRVGDQSLFVKNAIQEIVEEHFGLPGLKIGEWSPTAHAFYKMLACSAGCQAWYGDDKAAARLLHEHGIQGVKYLDGHSEQVGFGTRNYVLFDDACVEITHKNGKLLGAMPEAPADWDR